MKNIVERDIEYFNSKNDEALVLNEDYNSMYSLMLYSSFPPNETEIWYGTINEINVAVKTLCRFMEV